MRNGQILRDRSVWQGGLVLLGLIGMSLTAVAPPSATAAPAQKAQSTAVLPGGNGKKPINIQSESLDYFDKDQKLIYTGNVIAVQGDSKLKCSVLTIYLPPKVDGQSTTPTSTSQVQHMDAVGPVTLVSKDQIGTGDHGVYDKASDTVVLTGNVTLSQGDNVTKGDKLVYNLKSSQAKVTGSHVVSMFQPSDSTESASKK
jgi:lipopolysaccharide export system protein LptA